MSQIFKGIIPPVLTLFDKDKKFDKEGMTALIEKLVASDVDGLFFLGSAGEFAHLSEKERDEIAAFCTEKVAGRKKVLIGTAHSGTACTIANNKKAKEMGADGVVVVNPYYNPLAKKHLQNHYIELAQHTELPIIIYNFPALTGQSIDADVIANIVRACPNVVGLKDTIDNISHIRTVIQEVKSINKDFSVFTGYDEYLFQTLIYGGDGAIPASANFAPQITCGIYKAFNAGDFAKCVELQKQLYFLAPLYGLDTPFYNVVKYAASLCGIDCKPISVMPCGDLDESVKVKVQELVKKAGLI